MKSKQDLQSSIADIDQLAELFTFRQPKDIRALLDRNPRLIPILTTAYAKAQEYFPGSPLFLDLRENMEIAGDMELTGYIGTSLNWQEVQQISGKLIDDWASLPEYELSPEFHFNYEYL